MPALHHNIRRSLISALNLILAALLLSSCGAPGISPTDGSPSSSQSQLPKAQLAEVTFEAVIPSKLADGQSLFIEFLDEVTGLALNPSRARMQTTDGRNYGIKIPIVVGSVIKYRYYRDNDPAPVEHTMLHQQVRYRLYYVDGPGVVRDTVAAWKNVQMSGDLGRIQGQVANKGNNSPVINALVAAGGMQTLTSSDGSFILEGLPPGTHNLVVYSLDGSFRPFQQGAVVAPESTTPALILLDQSKTVKVTFVVRAPADGPNGAPLRMVGNTYALGNTFADLAGGMNVIASRAPLLSAMPDGRYSLTMQLPAGLDLRYKYTLGDGFWNAERSESGETTVRQLIVPDKDIAISDTVAAWKTKGFAPVTFTVSVPDNTPASDIISIQFNPFGWTQPIPMWQLSKNRWFYVLYNPLNLFQSASVRYCRNDQCNVADASDTQGSSAKGISFTPKPTEQNIEGTVSSWAWLEASSEPVVVPGAKIAPRSADFQAGVEFMSLYSPSWQPYLPGAFKNIKDMGANTVMFTPSWHLTNNTPPVMAPVAGKDPMWVDLTQMALMAQQNNLSTVIHPILCYTENSQDWWKAAARDDGWWQSWFDRYQTFLLYHADLATQTGAKALVIGDETILPALPGGVHADGKPSGAPGDAEQRWKNLIASVRARYTGKLVWDIPYNGKLPIIPGFLSDVDLLYVQISAPLTKTDEVSLNDLEAAVTARLDKDILKLQEKTNHPILIGLSYPSVQGLLDGCVDEDGKCLGTTRFLKPAASSSSAQLGLKDQANAYSAVLSAVNQRSWVTGFFASGYYPAVEMRDLSVSVRNKPAGDVLWYWFPRLLGQTSP